MNLPSLLWLGGSSLRVALVGGSRKGLFSCADGEAAACNLLRVRLVHIGHDLLKGGGVEAVGEDGSPTDDVLSGGQLFGVPLQHFGLDLVPEGVGFGLGFFNQGFEFLKGFDLRGDFSGRHGVVLLCVL